MYSDLNYPKQEVFKEGLIRTLNCMGDEELPVRVTAGIGLKFVINNPLADEAVLPNLSQILDR